jgi:flavin reductase (DIM6/NTAB) family NADH-FMN oxidoreductase RutF
MPRSLSPVQETFKEVMAHIATPVAVVTSMDKGLPFGTTVSAFTSLSMHPPMMLVALDSGSQTLEVITASVRFGLNVLASGQHTTALNFARKGGVDKFQCVEWEIDHDVPRIAGAAGWIACTAEKFVEGGDHWIVVGNVVAADNAVGDPLTYHRRVFGTHCTLGQLKS